MKIKAPFKPGTTYAFTVFAECGVKRQIKVRMVTEKLEHGTIFIQQSTHCDKAKSCRGEECKVTSSQNRHFVTHICEDTDIKVILRPDANREAYAKVYLLNDGKMSAGTESCMAMQDCLRTLADVRKHADPAQWQANYKLRNSNLLQLQCLKSKGNMASSISKMNTACKKFYDCLSGSAGDKLHHLIYALTAMTVTSPKLSNTDPATTNSTKVTSCINPGGLDPELLECTCYDQLMDAGNCKSKPDTEKPNCVRAEICKIGRGTTEDKLCPHWYDSACSSGTSQAALLSRRMSADEADMESVESTLTGKCGS